MSDGGAIGSYTRYLLFKEVRAWERGDTALALGWRGKRFEETRTALPDTFPALEELAALQTPYTAVEDLRGPTEEDWATVEELTDRGLQRRLAVRVVAALAEL